MKKRLLYLVLCIFAVMTANAQITTIGIVGAGAGGWPSDVGYPAVDKNQMTKVDADNWILTNVIVSGPGIKFRANNSWDTKPTGLNVGAPATGSQWPTATGIDNGGASDIKIGVIPGTYTVKLNTATLVYSFEGGIPPPVVNLVGTAVTGGTVPMIATSLTTFELYDAILLAGNAQFEVDGALAGGLTFPDGTADNPASNIPVSAGKYTKITFDVSTSLYTFVAAPLFEVITLTGDAVVAVGWGNDTADFGHTDADNYFLHDVALLASGACKFRKDHAYATTWGNDTVTGFPTATSNGQNISPNVAGNYDAKINIVTGVYGFAFPLISITGQGAGGWGVDHDLITTDGENYTLSGITLTDATPITEGILFRRDHDWVTKWGGSWPSGVSNGSNIPSVAGTYDVTFTRSTGAYSFTTALATASFNKSAFSVYPNPTSNSWNFTTSNSVIKSIQIFDINGKSVKTVNVKDNAASVDASTLSRGVYFAKISSDTSSETVKLMKK